MTDLKWKFCNDESEEYVNNEMRLCGGGGGL